MSSAFVVIAWAAVIATLAFGGTERRLEESCSKHAPTIHACRRM
jgi:hypothetical protein